MLKKNNLPLLSSLSDLQQTINRIFQPMMMDQNNNALSSLSNWSPRIDVKDEANQYIIQADIPGVDPKDIDVSMENGMLTIKGQKQEKKEEERDGYVCLERSEGSFFRSMNLPNADSSKINAKSKNGVLEITVPKSKENKAQKIKIKEE